MWLMEFHIFKCYISSVWGNLEATLGLNCGTLIITHCTSDQTGLLIGQPLRSFGDSGNKTWMCFLFWVLYFAPLCPSRGPGAAGPFRCLPPGPDPDEVITLQHAAEFSQIHLQHGAMRADNRSLRLQSGNTTNRFRKPVGARWAWTESSKIITGSDHQCLSITSNKYNFHIQVLLFLQ